MPLDGTTFHRAEPDGLRRLRRLLVVMEAAPPEEVDIRETDCGTVACVYGWARRDAVLRKEGVPVMEWGCAVSSGCFGDFLGATEHEEWNLIMPYNYPDPIGAPAKAEAIKRIRALIAKYEAIHMAASAEAVS